MLSFKNLGLDLQITPSLSLPRAPHIPPGRPKFQYAALLLVIFFDFLAFKKSCKICFEKISEKVRKSRISASQNPAKTLSKSFQNRGPKKHAIFH